MILRAVLGKKWLRFSKFFSKNCGFLSKLGQRNQSIQSSFGLSFVSSTDNWPYMEFLTDIIALSGIFVKNWHTLFGIFSWKCDPNSWHTPIYSSYGSSPPRGFILLREPKNQRGFVAYVYHFDRIKLFSAISFFFVQRITNQYEIPLHFFRNQIKFCNQK